ncbi:hypothetical protein [Campylobacter majalis]|uniref:hypothetical protein n=1 Tax=Campylobacter majalis TaxID=2790656 RepID=UPI003D691F05
MIKILISICLIYNMCLCDAILKRHQNTQSKLYDASSAKQKILSKSGCDTLKQKGYICK